MIRICGCLLLVLCTLSGCVTQHQHQHQRQHQKVLDIAAYKSTTFNTASSAPFTITVLTQQAGLLDMHIMSPDGDVVRHLVRQQHLPAGKHQFDWDGKDQDGLTVANEAYTPRLTLQQGDKTRVYDPTSFSGGEVVQKIPVAILANNRIEFTLQEPARILARVGIKSGPMLNHLASWQPRPAGVNLLHWDGRDIDQVRLITQHPRFSTMVTGYQLPRHAIITFGNKQYSYAEYRTIKQWHQRRLPGKTAQPERNGKALSRFFFEPKYKPMDPQVDLQLTNTDIDKDTQLPILTSESRIKVNIPTQDRWVVEDSLYEVGFFVDYDFVSEEEQGYVPFIWQFNPQFLSSGRHILTVNISGFNGQVGVANVEFIVQKD